MTEEQNKLNEAYFDSSNLYVFLYKYKMPLVVLFILSSVISAIASLTIQEKFKSTAIIYPSNTSSVAKALINTSFGGHRDIMEYGDEEKSEHLLEILNSDKVRSQIVKEFNLMSHYDINTEDSETPNHDLNEVFEDNFSFKQNKNMAVEIVVLDHSADTAALLANAVLKTLDDVVNNINNERAVPGLKVVKQKYEELKKEIELLEDSLKFIMKKGVLNIESQSVAYGEAHAKAIASGNNSAAAALQEKLDVLTNYGSSFLGLNTRLDLERGRLSDLKGRYEEAKVDAESKIQNFFVVTNPFAAEKKSYPIRWLIVLVSVMGAMLTGILSIFFYEQSQKVKAQL